MVKFPIYATRFSHNRLLVVRLGNSGLKVSKVILGTMQYGDKDWQQWLLNEEEAIKHIKTALAFILLPFLVISLEP